MASEYGLWAYSRTYSNTLAFQVVKNCAELYCPVRKPRRDIFSPGKSIEWVAADHGNGPNVVVNPS